MGMIGCYGSFNFVCSEDQVRTFRDFSLERKNRWAQHDRIGGKPVLEWIGEDLATASLTIKCDVSLGVPPKKWLAKLHRMTSNGWHKKLIIGTEYFGQFVMEGVSNTYKYFDGHGNCISAEATLSLKEWSK